MKQHSKAFLDFQKVHRKLSKLLGEPEEWQPLEKAKGSAKIGIKIIKGIYVNGQGFSSP